MWAVFLCAGPCRGNMPLKRRTGRAASRGKTPLPDSTGPCSGNMPLKRRTGRAASRGKTPLPDSTGPCSGNMPLKRRTGRAASRGKNSPARFHRVVQRKLLLTQRAPRRQAEKLYSISCISAPFIFSLRISRILITLFNQFDIIFLCFFLIFFNYLSIIIFFMHDLA